ncbi:MAG: hypothetical protein GXX09_02415 [Syntrophomonadaceae bacterium]|nr:hypothetical protein [Syntrophomonadaceae bacterium]
MTDKEFQKFVIDHLVKMSEELDKLRQNVARIEIEHGEKLSALFDGYKGMVEKLDDHTQRLQRIEDKLETHEIQIKVLDATKANKRKVK